MLFFYTGAEEKRPTYRRGILDTLCYPAGHILEYSYRVQNIQDELPDPRNKAAVIVFVDMDAQRQPHYMPLRFATVLSPPLVAGEKSERIRFALRLGDFVHYPDHLPDHWHKKLKPLDEHRDFQGHTPRLFVIDTEFCEPSWAQTANQDIGEGRTAWEEVVGAVSQSTMLKMAVFVKLDLKDWKSAATVKLKPKGDHRLYELRSGRVYGLDICIYKGPMAEAEETSVTLSSSSDLVGVGQPFQSVVSGLTEYSSLISCKRTVTESLSALGLVAKEPVPKVVNTPNPFLLLHVSISKWVLVLFVVLVLIGGFLVSLDPDSIKESLAFCAKCKFASGIAKFFGACSLAAAAWLGFRKLPSS